MISGLLMYCKISILDKMAFRHNLIIRTVTGFFSSYVTVAVWQVITIYNQSSIGVETADMSIKYMIVSTILSTIFYSPDYYEVYFRVQNGNLAYDMVKPIPLVPCLFSKELGSAALTFFTNGLSTIVILTLLFQIHWEWNLIAVFLFFLFALLGFFINHTITLCFDLLSFWVYETEALHYIRTAVLSLLSGSLVPLWFYPEKFQEVIEWLPFQGIIYVPVSLLLGVIPSTEAPRLLLVDLMWCLILVVIIWVVWNRGTRKVTINGG